MKLSSRHQIVIPREVRDALGLKAGDKLLVMSHEKDLVILRKPESFTDALRGLFPNYPPDYIDRERDSWD